jgi:hypothetical protein
MYSSLVTDLLKISSGHGHIKLLHTYVCPLPF